MATTSIIIAITLVAMVSVELLFGRKIFPPKIKIWGTMEESSMQMFDWYSPSHVIHGFIFYWCGQLWIAVLLEAIWEMVENSSFVINYYRQKTTSTDYQGDTVLNSLCDILCVVAGYALCLYVPYSIIIALIVAMELLTLYLISDNLTLNILMFILPLQSIKDWQTKRNKK